MKKKLFILGLIICMFSVSVLAENIYNLQQDKDWVDSELEGVIYERQEHQGIKEYYENIAQNLVGSQLEQAEALLKYEGVVEELNKTMSDMAQVIAITEYEYEEKIYLLKKRIIDGYINSKVSVLSILVGSDSMSQFYEKLEIRKYLADYDQQIIDDLKNLSLDITEKRARAEALQISYEVAVRKTEIAIGNMEYMQGTAEKTAKMSAEQIAILIKKEDDLIVESERILEAIREEQQNMKYAGGEMIWPVPANRSKLDPGDFFGMRMHPIFHVLRMHTGIDIGAPTRANILAANSGTVIITGWSTGYGYKIVVDHGGGIVTLYAHCSKILVNTGQKVEQGQVIGLIGSTGWATGPHLHFEVIKDGKRINPLEYVNQKSGT